MGRRGVWIALCLIVLAAVSVFGFQPPVGQEQFVPISELPPDDKLPAAPLLIAAYAFVWAVLMLYLWSIWRRIGRVETDMRALEQRSAHRSTAR